MNSKVTAAKYGDRKMRAKMLIMPPINEYKIPTPKAFPASPCSAIGPPSKTVAIDDGVPGILSNIAEINPPEIPPRYNPTSREIPSTVGSPKDNGKNNTIAIVEDNPGIDPKIMPIITPNVIRAKQVGVRTSDNPSSTMSLPP